LNLSLPPSRAPSNLDANFLAQRFTVEFDRTDVPPEIVGQYKPELWATARYERTYSVTKFQAYF
jgi:hypothetical protein